jgi:hypothetical protein
MQNTQLPKQVLLSLSPLNIYQYKNLFDNWNFRVARTIDDWQNLISKIEKENDEILKEINSKTVATNNLNDKLRKKFAAVDTPKIISGFSSLNPDDVNSITDIQEQQICRQWYSRIQDLDKIRNSKQEELLNIKKLLNQNQSRVQNLRKNLQEDYNTNFIPSFNRAKIEFNTLNQKYIQMGIINQAKYQNLLNEINLLSQNQS